MLGLQACDLCNSDLPPADCETEVDPICQEDHTCTDTVKYLIAQTGSAIYGLASSFGLLLTYLSSDSSELVFVRTARSTGPEMEIAFGKDTIDTACGGGVADGKNLWFKRVWVDGYLEAERTGPDELWSVIEGTCEDLNAFFSAIQNWEVKRTARLFAEDELAAKTFTLAYAPSGTNTNTVCGDQNVCIQCASAAKTVVVGIADLTAYSVRDELVFATTYAKTTTETVLTHFVCNIGNPAFNVTKTFSCVWSFRTGFGGCVGALLTGWQVSMVGTEFGTTCSIGGFGNRDVCARDAYTDPIAEDADCFTLPASLGCTPSFVVTEA